MAKKKKSPASTSLSASTRFTAYPTLSPRSYKALLRDVDRILSHQKSALEHTLAQHLLNTYFDIGTRILAEKLSEQSGYHNDILTELSADTAMALRTLQRAVRFAQSYPSVPSQQGLTWSHVRLLLQLTDTQERSYYQRLVSEERLSAKRLSASITSDRYESQRKSNRTHKASRIKRPQGANYLYHAQLHRIIDPDTLHLDIDLGFEVFRRQRLRLALIDAQEGDSALNRKAKRWLHQQLGGAKTLVVQTKQVDVHGRYVAHVFYSGQKLKAEACFVKGRYLNQRLVDKGFARRV